MFWIITSLTVRHREDTAAGIRKDLMDNGRTLVSNNAKALGQLAADNAFLAVAELVATTVRDDPDVVYGIFMDANRQPWVVADAANPEGRVRESRVLGDSASLWAADAGTGEHRVLVKDGQEVFEFAAPVLVDSAREGTIRYGLSTGRMRESLARASEHSSQALLRTIGSVLLLGFASVLMAFLATRRLAVRLTRPIRNLQAAANAIARGEYGLAIASTGEDEIAMLAADFDSMRVQVKGYTERLHDMVEEKVREIRDILNNIGQGLFTVSPDGAVNPDYASTTNAILGVEDVARSSLGGLFRLDEGGVKDWMDWMDLVRSRHGSMPWSRLERLCPVRELELGDGKDGRRFIQVGYQPMLDGHGRPGKLMVLVQDVTETRRAEAIIRREQEKHQDEVKAILGVVHNAATLPDFLADAERLAGESLSACLEIGEGKWDDMPALLRNLHTLKGTASTFGFAAIEGAARKAELVADRMRASDPAAAALNAELRLQLEGDLSQAIQGVKALSGRLTGLGDDPAVPVAKRRLEGLRAAALAVRDGSSPVPPEKLDLLLEACRSLDNVRFSVAGDRYRSMIQRLAARLGKSVDLRVRPGTLDVSPRLIAALDEPLVHLLRNAVDHGIEGREDRVAAGKAETGLVEVVLEPSEKWLLLAVEDDGRGIDTGKVLDKALAKGALDAGRAAAMTEQEKAALIFMPGLSTSERNDDISGMGVGMDAVAAWVKSQGGTIGISSRPGRGTRIEMVLPAYLPEVMSSTVLAKSRTNSSLSN